MAKKIEPTMANQEAAKSTPDSESSVDVAKLKARQKLARSKEEDIVPEVVPTPVSAGPVDRLMELAFNPSREKIREVTIVDRIQGRLFPLMDMVNLLRKHCLEIALYRQDSIVYKKIFKRDMPIQPDPLDELLFRTAQWQKSVAGKNLERATDIALAETEIRAAEDEPVSGDAWKE